MNEIILFDIPVYRLPENVYYKERGSYITKCFNDIETDGYIMEKIRKENHKEYLENKYGGIWLYNEIIGYIRLYVLGYRIYGKYFENDAKRQVRTRKKRFKYITDKIVPEISLGLHTDGTSTSIYQAILKYLKECKKKLKKRFIDLSIFESLGTYVDWKCLLENRAGYALKPFPI